MIHLDPFKKLLCLGLPAIALSHFSVTDSFAGPTGGGSIGGIAEREIARRLERVQEAEADVAEGQRLWKEKDYEGARAKFKTAVDKIPDAPLVQEQRSQAIQQFADVSVLLADQKARGGARDEARQILDGVLADDIDPYNKDAKKILVRLDDPEWYNHALTPKHVENVAEVERLLKVGKGYYDLGDYDEAEKQYDAVLRIDPYNHAARRGHEELENRRRRYLDAARDHTRALLLRKVDQAWETAVPQLVFNTSDDTGDLGDGRAYIQRKLRETIIPSVRFDEATVDEAVQYLRQKAAEHDPFETDEARKGVNIVIRNSAGPGEEAAAPVDASITLSLSNIPLADALQYVADGAGMKYKVEPIAVVLVPAWVDSNELYTRSFRVPPSFLSSGGSGDGGGAAVADDPFAAADPGGGTTLARPKTATEILSMQGITFPDGASAFFNPATSTLVVRNTQQNMELIEVFVQNMRTAGQNQVFIMTKFVEVTQQNLDELGFDWMLGQFNAPGSDRVFAGGGSTGNQRNGEINSSDYTFVPPGGAQPVPTGQFPVTSGLRFGLDAIQSNAIDALINEQQITSRITPGVFGVGGVLTDPQFQVVMRALNQRKGTDLMTAPSVVTRSGQRAKIEIIREFIYPTEFDPPEIPQEFGSISGFGGGGGNGFDGFGSANSFPVTPANPTAFEMRPVGVTLEVDPVVGADNLTIELNIAPEVVEFEGFINYGSPIQTSAVDALGQPTTVVLTENRIEQPVFSTRKLTTAVTIWDGQTVAIGGLIREDVQHVEDKVPIFGDIPLVGRFFRTNAENHFKRNLMIFVTAEIIDPSGRRINTPGEGGPDAGDAGGIMDAMNTAGGPSSALFGSN